MPAPLRCLVQYYTDYKFQPVRTIAESSTTGHATNIIAGRLVVVVDVWWLCLPL